MKHNQALLRDVKIGDYFRLKITEHGATYQRHDLCSRHYNGAMITRFSCTNQDTGKERLIPGDKKVFVGFYY